MEATEHTEPRLIELARNDLDLIRAELESLEPRPSAAAWARRNFGSSDVMHMSMELEDVLKFTELNWRFTELMKPMVSLRRERPVVWGYTMLVSDRTVCLSPWWVEDILLGEGRNGGGSLTILKTPGGRFHVMTSSWAALVEEYFGDEGEALGYWDEESQCWLKGEPENTV